MSDISKLKDVINSKEFMDKFEKSIIFDLKLKEKYQKKIEEIFNKLSKKEKIDLLEKFLKWEEKLEERYLNDKHVYTHSKLFPYVMEFLEQEGHPDESEEYEDFLALAFVWDVYVFKLYVGQGSFWRIFKNDEVIFQSA